MNIAKMTSNVFVVRRAYSNAFFSSRLNKRDTSAIVAFRDKRMAQRFIGIENAFHENPKKRQPLVVDYMSVDSLKRRCAVNRVTLVIYDLDLDITEFDCADVMVNVDAYQFHLENVLKYFE